MPEDLTIPCYALVGEEFALSYNGIKYHSKDLLAENDVRVSIHSSVLSAVLLGYWFCFNPLLFL